MYKQLMLGLLLAGWCDLARADLARAAPPIVATDIAPVHSLVAQVMDGVGAPKLIIQHGASPHAYRLKPSDAKMLQIADLVVWVGGDLTPGLARGLRILAPDTVQIALMELPQTRRLPIRKSAIFDEGEEDKIGPDHTDLDLHIWLDPENASYWLGAIAEELAKIDPKHASLYRANADAAQAKLAATTSQIQTQLAAASVPRFIVYHDAYQYFEARFGLRADGAIATSDMVRPSVARLAALRNHLVRAQIRCIFSEPQFQPKLIAGLNGKGETTHHVIDPLGAHLPAGKTFYGALIRSVSAAMLACSDQK